VIVREVAIEKEGAHNIMKWKIRILTYKITLIVGEG